MVDCIISLFGHNSIWKSPLLYRSANFQQSQVTNVQDVSFYKNNPTPTWIIPFSLHSTHIELAKRQHVWIYLQGLYVVLLRFCKRIIATFLNGDQEIAITLTTNWLTDWRQTPLSIALSFKLTNATNTMSITRSVFFTAHGGPRHFTQSWLLLLLRVNWHVVH